MSTTITSAAAGALLVRPEDEGWDEARLAWNLAADQRPAAVALPETADEVVAVVEHARAQGLHVAAQGTGHNAHPLTAHLDDTILVKTSRMRAVTVDPERRSARVEAGAAWGEVVAEVSTHGLTALSGSSHDVGVVGYCLGGGLSWLARKHGLCANNVLAIELVTADGRLVRADHETEPELFWALRGGGGNFGVVTAVELALFDVATAYAGMLLWPIERAPEVLRAWRDWTASAPEEVTTSARLLNLPPLEQIPEIVRGRSFVAIDGAILGDPEQAAALLSPLRDLEPEIDGFDTIPTYALIHIHMDPPEPAPGIGDGALVAELPDEAIDAMVAIGGAGSDSPLLMIELRQLGGAVARPQEHHGALAAIAEPYAMFAVGMAMTPEMGAAVRAAIPEVKGALGPWLSGRDYLNFAESAREDPAGFYADGVIDRLRAAKAQYDPEDLFRGNHRITPAA
ncbi:MAG TPA: FAD-binding oxidoreductase [Solirubrobacteraceae bacterium]|nr:FAD-binding oxidoreductase [Solirubrobacteraceae bacterium]